MGKPKRLSGACARASGSAVLVAGRVTAVDILAGRFAGGDAWPARS